jgi:hypothetical protein
LHTRYWEILLVLLLLVITVKLPYTKGVYLGVANVHNVVKCSVVKLLFKAVLAKGAKNIAAGVR